ncbi:hypothetical protein AMTRI_Chr11g96790 [Amborella trichopoda]
MAPSNFRIKNGRLAMEIPHSLRFIQTQRGSTGNSFRSNQFLGPEKDIGYVRHGLFNFFVKISTFCELSTELEDHFQMFNYIRGSNETIVTSATTQDETLPPWSGFLQNDEGDYHISRFFDGHKEIILVATHQTNRTKLSSATDKVSRSITGY